MSPRTACVLAGFAVLGGLPAFAQSASAPNPASAEVADPALEARVKALASELRCLVCQNQTVADSDSMVAQDMRREVRTLLAQGKTEAEVKRHMQERFGDFVLYRPPLKAETLLLWAGPFIVLTIAAWLLWRRLQAQRAISAPALPVERTAAASASDEAAARARARRLLEGDEA
ncbi:MAG: cytochrome c-type biogenesis protein [Casimicrobiaceae bacterium]